MNVAPITSNKMNSTAKNGSKNQTISSQNSSKKENVTFTRNFKPFKYFFKRLKGKRRANRTINLVKYNSKDDQKKVILSSYNALTKDIINGIVDDVSIVNAEKAHLKKRLIKLGVKLED